MFATQRSATDIYESMQAAPLHWRRIEVAHHELLRPSSAASKRRAQLFPIKAPHQCRGAPSGANSGEAKTQLRFKDWPGSSNITCMLFMYMCICMYVCIYVCMYMCIHIQHVAFQR